MKGLILTDFHYPYNLNYKKIKFPINNDIVIFLGDQLDFKFLWKLDTKKASSFNPDKFYENIKWAKELILYFKKYNPKAKIIWFDGNHEHRLIRWHDKFARDKMFSIKKEIGGLVSKYILYKTYRSYIQLGDTILEHGNFWTDAHAKKMLNAWGRKVLFGHTHDFQVYCDRTHSINKRSKFAMSCGCMCSKAPEWKGTPNRWVNGYVTFEIIKGVLIPIFNLLEKGINY